MVSKTPTVQLQIPTTNLRPGHVRSTSTSSIPVAPETLLSDPPQSPTFAQVATPLSPLPRPGVPPNTSQTMSGMVTPALDINAGMIMPNAGMITVLVGESGKSFKILTDLLTSRSPYFRELFGSAPATRRGSMISFPATTEIPEASDATLAFPELNEFAFSLFNRWLYGAQLGGPTDFHTMQHYLGLYVLASRFQVEKLENEVMDLTRAYYRATDLSSPPYRLEYIYEHTAGANKMREFLIATAAQHAVADGSMGTVMRDVMGQGGELTMDFIDALVKLQADDGYDVRRGKNCDWHNHVLTRRCRNPVSDD